MRKPLLAFCIVILVCPGIAAFAQKDKACDSLISKGITEMVAQQFAPAISDLTKAHEMAKRKKLYRQEFLSLNNLGLTYYKMLDYGNAIAFFLKAYELALANNAPTDEMIVLNNIAILYTTDGNYIQANQYFKKSYDIAVANQVKDRIGLYASNLAKLNLELHQLAVADQYVKEAVSHLDKDSQVMLDALITKYSILAEKRKYTEVIPEALHLLETAKAQKYPEETTELQTLLAVAYGNTGQSNKGGAFFNAALLSCTDDEVKIKIFEKLADFEFKLNDIRKVAAAKDSIIKLTLRINKAKNQELLVTSKLRFELAASKHELEISNALAQSRKKYYLIITFFLCIMLLILIWAFYKRGVSAKQKRVIAENNLRIIDLELNQQKTNSKLLENELREKELQHALENEKQKEKENSLQREIEDKNRQLSNKILFQSTRNELIEEIIQSVSNLPDSNNHSSLLKTISNLKSHLKEDARWDEFSLNFENVNNEFINALKAKHSNLSANDIRFLSFVYLNLSNKEIASLLHITPEACRKRKERISQKMEISINTPLYEYLSSL